MLCAGTGSGKFNHTPMSIEGLRQRRIPLLGVVFIGDAVPDTERTIVEFGRVRVLGCLPCLDPLTPLTLCAAMASGFNTAAFHESLA